MMASYMNRFFLTAVCFTLLIFSGTVCFSKATEMPINAAANVSAHSTTPCLPETMSDDMQNSVVAGLNS